MLRLLFVCVLALVQVIATTTPKPLFNQSGQYQQHIPLGIEESFWDDDFVPYKSDRHDSFDWRLLKEVLLKDNKNSIISPISVKILLALLAEGAGNQTITQRELSSVLPDIRNPILQREFHKRIIDSLKEKSDYYELNFGTKIFTDEFVEPRRRFTAIAKAHYDTDIEKLNFSNKEASVQAINQWCSDITEGHLKNVLNRDSLSNAVVVMLNAIYFDAVWRKPFSENDTFDFPFYLQPDNHIRATFMTQTDKFFYFNSASQWDAKILRLPYEGRKFSMTIILPNSKGGLNELITQLEGDGLKRLQWLMDEREVKVTIPKFRFEAGTQLKDTLETLGINEVFTEHASLPGFARGVALANQLKVSNVFQKAGLVVFEKGSRAFAATGITLENKFGGGQYVEEFNANRPFLFLIEDEKTGAILFAGKVTDPTRSS